MRNQKLQCLLIGKSKNFIQLVKNLTMMDPRVQLKNIVNTKKHIEGALKSTDGPNIVFISDEAALSLTLLASLVQKYNQNTVVVIVTQKTASMPIKPLFNGIEFAKLNINDNVASNLYLKNIVHIVTMKQQFRQCKRLLAIAEKRHTWLLDSSHEAIAYISPASHLYANTAYLALFDIESLEGLNKVAVNSLIIDDEERIFEAFLKYQAKHHVLAHTLLLSMKGLKKGGFRANVHVIPSVYNGKKCWQIWVHKINLNSSDEERRLKLRKEGFQLEASQKVHQGKNPFDSLNKELSDKKKRADVDLIFKGILKRQEVSLSALKLVPLISHSKKNNHFHSHYILSLKVPVAQKKGVDDLLFRAREDNKNERHQLFWDKVKVARLFQLLSKKSRLQDNYFIALSNASINNEEFTSWMLKSLKSLDVKSRNLTIMLPSDTADKHLKRTLEFTRSLKTHHCKIALNDFSIDSNILKIIRFINPEYIRLSLEWVKRIELDENRKNALSHLLRQLEVKNIQVIAPCSFSSEMRKMFVFSGVSFCQERTTKSA